MSWWRQVWDLTRREFLERAKSRAFQVVTLVTVAVILGVVAIVPLALRSPGPIRLGITDDVSTTTETALHERAAELDRDLAVTRYADTATAEQALRDGSIDAAYTGTTIIWLEEESSTIDAVVMGAAAAQRFRDAAVALGMSEAELAEVLTPRALETEVLTPPDPEAEPRRIGALIGLILLYMAILIFGQFVAAGVMEEKQSRVVEVVLSRVEPTQLLVAKVAGIGALGLLQLVVLGGTIWLGTTFVDIADVSLTSIGAEILVSIIFWFLIGYTLYAVLYAALGATVSRQEDLQGAAMLPLVLLLPGFFIAQVAQELPDSTLAVISSLVPFWSPMVMPVRAAASSVPLWQMVLAVALVVATSWLAIRVGGRIYRGAVLHIGARVRFRDAWRAPV